MMTKDDLENKIKSANKIRDIETIADEIMAIPVPWFFINQFAQTANQKFADFKLYMARKFTTPATDIFICGSALLGYSLSPEKNFANFNDNSDIDIVIISKKMFDKFWDNYFNDYVSSRLNKSIYTNTAKAVFKRFIDFHSTYSKQTKVYIEWEKQTSGYQLCKNILNYIQRVIDKLGVEYANKINKITHIYTLFVSIYAFITEKFLGKCDDEVLTAICGFYVTYFNDKYDNIHISNYSLYSHDAVASVNSRMGRYNSLVAYVKDRLLN